MTFVCNQDTLQKAKIKHGKQDREAYIDAYSERSNQYRNYLQMKNFW